MHQRKAQERLRLKPDADLRTGPTMRSGVVLFLATLGAGISAVVVATSIAGAAPAAQKPQWQVIPGVKSDFGEGNVVLSWVSNRAWIAATSARGMAVTSAGVSGRNLSAFKTTSVGATPHTRLVVESDLVYWTEQPGPSLQARELLANGGLGAPSAVPLELDQIAPQHGIGPVDAVRLGDRTIWALPGGTKQFNPRAVLWICCAEDGSARELTRLIDRASVPKPVHLGLDERGRLWLAWHDRSGVKIVELDPATLEPRAKPLEAPGRSVERFELVCAAVCRLVLEAFNTGIHSWAPGERSPTVIAKAQPVVQRFPRLFAAAHRSGDLVVAYEAIWPDSGRIRVVRGDARGTRPRLVGTSARLSVALHTHAVFVPAGLLAVTPKVPASGQLDQPTPVLIDLVRVGR